MGGRDPHEENRVSTPLELLFDLTFATSFGLAASQLAQALAQGHYQAGLFGFAIASFGICWAWINFSWFASGYDTDDWVFRVATMVQMTGVLVLAIGEPRMFASIEHGAHVDNGVMVLGYVIMRVALVFQWLRAASQDPRRRRACLTYAAVILFAQIGWVSQLFMRVSIQTSVLVGAVLVLIEFAGPTLAERLDGGTPWHAHHIAERFSLFAIIALGEGVVGTVAALSAVVERTGWTMDAALVGAAGTGLTFGIWWVYYMVPSALILHEHRERVFVWGYAQIALVTAIVATGAGLHVAAYFIENEAHISALATVLCVAIPLSTFLAIVFALYAYLVQQFDPFHVWLLAGTAAMVAAAIAAALTGVGMAMCLVILALAPVVSIVGYETHGYRHQAQALRH